MQNLQVCLPSCTINFLCPFNAATTRNRTAIKVLSLFIVGLMVCLSYLWSRKVSVDINRRIHNLTSIQLFWKHFLKVMHAGFTYDLNYCLSEPFLHVRLN